jgi:4-amino-4-deoxy-L-arabinose transferase-like glycosyltransferase
MDRTSKEIAIVVIVAGAAFLTNLGGAHLWDRDEPRNAGCAVEMLHANDWVTPLFNAELRTHKPVLTYWFMMCSYALLGIGEFSARFSSALLGIGTCLATYFIGRRLFGRSAGLWSAIALSTTLMFGVASRAATPDAPLIFFSTLSMAFYVAGLTSARAGDNVTTGVQRDFPDRIIWVVLMYASMAVAVLAKGPIGIILPAAVIGMFLLIRRLPATVPSPRPGWQQFLLAIVRPFAPLHFLRTCLAMRLWIAVAALVVIALPWYAWVHLRTGGAWTYGFFLTHNVGRAMQAMDGHRGGFLFYPLALLVGFFPWSIFWLPAVVEAVRLNRQRDGLAAGALLALCWVGVYLGLFSLAKTQLPSYITPCYPGMALLTGLFLDRWSRQLIELPALWRRLAFGSLIFVGVATTIALPVVSHFLLPGEAILGLVGLIPLVGGCLALWQAENGRPDRASYSTAGTASIFAVVLFAGVAARIDRHRHVEDLVQAVYQGQALQQVEVASLGGSEASWIFYCGQPILQLNTPEQVQDWLTQSSEPGRRRVALARGKSWPADPEHLADFSVGRVPYFMRDDDILVLTPHSDAPRSAALPVDQSSR